MHESEVKISKQEKKFVQSLNDIIFIDSLIRVELIQSKSIYKFDL